MVRHWLACVTVQVCFYVCYLHSWKLAAAWNEFIFFLPLNCVVPCFKDVGFRLLDGYFIFHLGRGSFRPIQSSLTKAAVSRPIVPKVLPTQATNHLSSKSFVKQLKIRSVVICVMLHCWFLLPDWKCFWMPFEVKEDFKCCKWHLTCRLCGWRKGEVTGTVQTSFFCCV